MNLVAVSPACLYAGNLVPPALQDHGPPGARAVNTAVLTLDAIIDEMAQDPAAGQGMARLHSGELSVWSAMGEQRHCLRAWHSRLDEPGPWPALYTACARSSFFDLKPEVPSFAAAAALQAELTLPGLAQ